MATPFRLKRSSVASKRPGLADLQKGELALNFYDGHLFAERDTAGVGIGTTIANLTPWKETFGGAAINYENSVGIGSTNPTGRLDVSGLTVLDEVKISGVTTFSNNVGFDTSVNFSGVTTFTDDVHFIGATSGRDIIFDHSENRIEFKDHAKAVFGDGNKFQIFHNGSSAFVQNFTGNLELQAPANSSIDLNRTARLEEGLNVTAGVSTFAETVKASDRLEVDGVTDLDELTVTGVSTFSAEVGFNTHVSINDHSKLSFGNGNDLEIYHNEIASFIKDVGTGSLIIQGSNVRIQDAGSSETAFLAADGVAELYHENSKKFSTTGVGVSILNGIGATFATISAPAELIIDPNTVGDNTGLVRIKGDLYVDGTEFIVDSETIKLADHVVGIASTSTTDALTDGAGIGIGTNKFFTFDNSNTAFKSTENINLESGHSYKIDGSDVLSADTLGAGVINSSLTNLGTLTHLNVTGVTTSTGGFRAGTGGTTFTTKSGRVGINTSQASEEHMLEVYGNINIVGDDVDFYENGKRRTAGVGIHSRGTVVAGLGATIIDFVGTAVSSILFSDVGIATVNLRKTSFTRNTTSYTATSGQTSYPLTYTPGFIDVYVNGVRLTASEFTATNGSSVVLNTGAFTGDIVDITAYVDDGIELGGGKWSPQDGTPSNIFYSTGNVGVHSASPKVTLDVVGEARVTGVVTAGAYLVGGNQVISSARELQNIASLDATTTATIETAIANAPNTFTDIEVTGITTFKSTVNVEDLSLNRVVFVGAGSSLTDDTNFTFDGSKLILGVGATVGGALTAAGGIDVNTIRGATNNSNVAFGARASNGAHVISLILKPDRTATFDGGVGIADSIFHIGDDNTQLRFPEADTFTVETDGTERLRITDGGSVGIGITNPASYSSAARALVVGSTSSYSGLTIRSATAGIAYPEGSIYFADGVSGSAGRGRIVYNHGDDSFYVSTSSAERLRINATGVGIGSTAPKGDVDIGEQFSIKTTTTAVSSTAATTVDSLPIATYRSSRFQVQITQGTDYQSADLMVIHDGTTATLIEYGSIATANMLATFTSTISGSNLLLQVNMGSSTSATVKVVRYGISI